MATRLTPYLNFNGNARQAMAYYASVFGGDLALNTFAELGPEDSPDADRILHAQLVTDAGYRIMASDVPSGSDFQPMAGVAVNISGDEEERLRGYWEKLTVGGSITIPLRNQPWGDEFGMCVDQFGISWMIDIGQPEGPA